MNGLLSVLYLVRKLRSRLRPPPLHIRHKLIRDIRVVTNESECAVVIEELKSRCQTHHAVGFDCEWVATTGRRKPVALLQLSSFDGLCGLFRLSQIKNIPASLKDFLEDKNIYKVGVVPMKDAIYLIRDYSVIPTSTLDIRHIVQLCGHDAGGLAKLAKTHLGFTMDKHCLIRCSNWEAKVLTKRQELYAAMDAYVALQIFVHLITLYQRKNTFWFIPFKTDDFKLRESVDRICPQFADVSFEAMKATGVDIDENKRGKNGYVEKGLADLVSEEPVTVRLRSEPAGRATGFVGRYYQLAKENCCVVCGQAGSYIRKNLVPREYRKYFPKRMKHHLSHNKVLLCVACNQRSYNSDRVVRRALAAQCGAPLPGSKYVEDTGVKSVRSAARALLKDAKKHNLPDARRKELEKIILNRFPGYDEVINEILVEARTLQILHENEHYESHGSKVVEHYAHNEGGLLKLERLWRQHFLDTMEPQFLPDLWCVNHNEERYVEKGLADRVSEEPVTVRLRSEPAGRATGSVGRYNQLSKKKRCVVCGQADSYIRKNVVPRDYRKYFPEIMKEQSSHNKVLLCVACHKRSNSSDLVVRRALAAQCGAPLPGSKYVEDTGVKHENEHYESHGSKVVEHYAHNEGGLLKLERLWRQHFLDTMEPQFLPDLWRINHNEERLMIRVREGRIDNADIKIVGLEAT